MSKYRRGIFAVWIALVVTLTGCGTLDDVRDKVDTIDQGTELLDDLDQNGTQVILTDGLEALSLLEEGYVARVTLVGSATSDFVLDLQADGSGAIRATLDENGASTDYLIVDDGHDLPAGVYRLSGGNFMCATGSVASLLAADLTGIVARLTDSAAGMGLLSAFADAEDVTLLDREATRYVIVSRVGDALNVLADFENDGLAVQATQAGQFTLDGSLTLDDGTGALLAAHSVFTPDGASNEPGAVTFNFEVIQWGTDARLTLPDAAAITVACP